MSDKDSAAVIRARDNRRRWREKAVANGLCPKCGRRPPHSRFKHCAPCLDKSHGPWSVPKYARDSGDDGLLAFAKIGDACGFSTEYARTTYTMTMKRIEWAFECIGINSKEVDIMTFVKLGLSRWTTLHHWTQFLTVAIDGWKNVDAEWSRP